MGTHAHPLTHKPIYVFYMRRGGMCAREYAASCAHIHTQTHTHARARTYTHTLAHTIHTQHSPTCYILQAHTYTRHAQ